MSDVQIKDLLIRYYRLVNKPGPHNKIMGYTMMPHEAIFLYSLVLQEQPDVIFESGTAMGWSASWMLLASNAPIYTYDPNIRPRLFEIKKKKFNFINDSFSTVVHKLPEWVSYKKLFFIDGDHSMTGLLEDFNSIEQFLESEDIIVLHDTVRESGVIKGFKKIQRKYPHWDYKHIKTYNGMEVIRCV